MSGKAVVNCDAEIVIIGVLGGVTVLFAIIIMVVIIMLCRLRKQIRTRAAYLEQTFTRTYDSRDYHPPAPSLESYVEFQNASIKPTATMIEQAFMKPYDSKGYQPAAPSTEANSELTSDSMRVNQETKQPSEFTTKNRHTISISDMKSLYNNGAPPKPKRTFETTDNDLILSSTEKKSSNRRNSWPLISGSRILPSSLKGEQFNISGTENSKSNDILDSKRDSSMQTVPPKPDRKRMQSLPEYENVLFDRISGKIEIGIGEKNVNYDVRNSIEAQDNFAFRAHSAIRQDLLIDNEALRRASAKSNIPRAVSGRKRKSDENFDVNLEAIEGEPKRKPGRSQGPRSRTLPAGGHGGFKRRVTHERTKSDVVRQPRTQQLDQFCKRLQVDNKPMNEWDSPQTSMSNGVSFPSYSDDTEIKEIQPGKLKQSSTCDTNEDTHEQSISSQPNGSARDGVTSITKNPQPRKPSRLRQPAQYYNVTFRRNNIDSSDNINRKQVDPGDKEFGLDNVFVEEPAAPICGTMERREVARVVKLDLKSEPMTEL